MTATTNTALQQMRRLFLLITLNWLLMLRFTAADPVVDLLTPTSSRHDYIPFDKWHCGASDFDKHLSHQLSESECPARMYEANLCCLAHDLCYVEVDKTQEYCDSAFCFCLNRTLSMPNTNYTLGCSNVAEGFCDIVQIFGAAAHSSAQRVPNTTSTTSTTSTTTTTTPSTNTTTTSVPSTTTTASPADIVQFVTHNISLDCYSRELGNCLEDLHKCVITQSNPLADPSSALSNHPLTSAWPGPCSEHFCECASGKPVLNKIGYLKKDKRCENSFQMVCSATRPVDSVHVNIQLWTTNVNYLGNGQGINSVVTILLLALLSVLTLVVLLFLIFKCYRRYKANRSEGYGISAGAAAEFVSRARRHTLRKEENQEPGYKCFHDDKCSSERLHTHDHLLPMNSSKAQLIAEDSNSTRSTPSINSAA